MIDLLLRTDRSDVSPGQTGANLVAAEAVPDAGTAAGAVAVAGAPSGPSSAIITGGANHSR
jgi:hypothetical protein